MSIVSIQDVRKEFGDIVAVSDASFDIKDGEFVSILGPSGSGKSTILRMIAGFETPTSGAIAIDGDDVVGVPPFNRNVNMVFQSLALFPHLTVAENIAYGLKQQGVGKEERSERIDEMLSVVHLEGYNDRMPDELSGGEQQRVALARAIVNEPKIVLFDEPLASLDRKLRQHMQRELQRIQAETGITFLYVTHDQEVALAVSDRMILLRDGEIEQIGTAEQLYDSPVSKFVADFIGDANDVEAQVVDSQGDTFTIDVGGDHVTVPSSVAQRPDALSIDGSVDVSFRPDLLSVTNEKPENGQLTIGGTVINRIYKGDEMTFVIETELGEITVHDEGAFDIGDDVAVAVAPESVNVFEKATPATHVE